MDTKLENPVKGHKEIFPKDEMKGNRLIETNKKFEV